MSSIVKSAFDYFAKNPGDSIQAVTAIFTLLAIIVAMLTTRYTLNREKEGRFRESRPYSIVRFNMDKVRNGNPRNAGDRRKRIYVTSQEYVASASDKSKNKIDVNKSKFSDWYSTQKYIRTLSLNNVSQKSMMAVKILTSSKNQESPEEFRVDLIPKETQLFVISEKIFAGEEWAPDRITVYFTNELREREKLVFDVKDNGGINYRHKLTKLENKIRWYKPDSHFSKTEYILEGFSETQRLHL